MQKSREILNKYWGFDSFRPLQEDIIHNAINGHDTLALLPTGGGKSICFQIPGIAREGITIVISPLIALMQDQTSNLRSKGIRAAEIVNGMSYRDIDITLNNACFGGIDFLYVSPERVETPLFKERFKAMKVALIVIDEAHCISQWGHDFRPSYLNVKRLREVHPEVPVMALTATATEAVKQDIIEQLKLKGNTVFEGSFHRPNLTYQVKLSENKSKQIIDHCTVNSEVTGIVYCQTRKSVKDIARLLVANKLKVGIYHGGMNQEDRKMIMNAWLNGELKIMVATNAFGMGIDKPNVRYVLHYEFPNNLEAYFQEAGRAGRDGLLANSFVYIEEKDLIRIKNWTIDQYPEIEQIKHVYRALCNYLKIAIGSGKGETYFFDLYDFIKKFSLEPKVAFNALKILEINDDLVFSEGFFHPTRLRFSIGNKELYSFQIKNSSLAPIISLLTRSYPGIFDAFFRINETEIAKLLKSSNQKVTAQLKDLEKYGVIDVTWKTDLPSVTLSHERLPDDYLQLTQESYHKRKESALKKMESALNFLTVEACRLSILLTYFGQEKITCGNCDYCRSQLPQATNAEIESLILDTLVKPSSLSDLVAKFQLEEKSIINVLQQLLLEEKIIEEAGNFKLKTL